MVRRLIVSRVVMDSVQRVRRRLNRLRAAGRLVVESASTVDLSRELRPGRLAVDDSAVTNALFDRLSADDLADLESRIEASGGGHPDIKGGDEATRRFLLLSLGMWLRAPQVIERTGLLPQFPPDEAHAMARGPLAAAGGLYEADMVVAALRSAGVDMAGVHSGLDFGCSSGRVVRVLAAAYPEISWSGCDPNRPAVQWANENLPGIDFFVSGNEPPLPNAHGELDLVYAISIWSHFEPRLGLRWFEEIHRVLAPGGHLVVTTHGLASIEHYLEAGSRWPAQALEIQRALYSSGSWFAAEFGEQGDWGVINPAWGTAFLSPEWMLANLCPRWRVLEFSPGRNQQNQDIYVLERG